MIKSVARSVVSAIAAVCFTAAAVGPGMMPGCTMAHGVHATPHASEPSHSHSHGGLPDTRCLTHLCCANLVSADLSTGAGTLSLVPAPTTSAYSALTQPVGRTPYLLPFANAPPNPA
jgi:hypothetical protein